MENREEINVYGQRYRISGPPSRGVLRLLARPNEPLGAEEAHRVLNRARRFDGVLVGGKPLESVPRLTEDGIDTLWDEYRGASLLSPLHKAIEENDWRSPGDGDEWLDELIDELAETWNECRERLDLDFVTAPQHTLEEMRDAIERHRPYLRKWLDSEIDAYVDASRVCGACNGAGGSVEYSCRSCGGSGRAQ